jgi:hypothetical protein
MPQHVPPSDDVRDAGERAAVRARIRRAKWRHLAFWYLIGALGAYGVFVAASSETYWVLPWIAGIYTGLFVFSQTTHADAVYRSAYAAGLAMGIVASREAAAHAAWHAAHGEEHCDAVGIKAVVPHMWEHPFVREEIDRLMPGVFEFSGDEDDDEPRS